MKHDPISDVLNFLQQPAFVSGPTWPTAVFWVLVLTSLAIAAYAFATIPGQRRVTHLWNWAFRFLIGCMWWQQTLWKLPLGNSSAEMVAVKYPSDGGYSLGDTWDLYLGPDSRIEEMAYRAGGPAKHVVIATWADYKKAGPLLVSLEHRGTNNGQPAHVFFSNVAVKLVGSNTWLHAQ